MSENNQEDSIIVIKDPKDNEIKEGEEEIKVSNCGIVESNIKIQNTKEYWKRENEKYFSGGRDLSDVIKGNEDMSTFEIVKSFFGQIRGVSDAYRVSIPITFIQPISFLERLSNQCNPSNFLDSFSKNSPIIDHDLDDGERFLRVLQWQLSTWIGYYRKGINNCKPFNPILGEFFSCKWDHKSDQSSTFFMSEQVSHHPPISAFHCENEKRGIVYRGNVYPSIGVGMNYMYVYVLGNAQLELRGIKKKEGEGEEGERETYKEVYQFEFPPIAGAGIFWGSLRMELFEYLTVKCPQTGWEAEIEFLWGKNGEIKGTIGQHGEETFHISGNINEKVFMNIAGDKGKSVFLDFNELNQDEKVVKGLDEMKDNESRRVWHESAKLLVAGDEEKAQFEKNKVETIERNKRLEREKYQQKFKQHFFEKEADQMKKKLKKKNKKIKVSEKDLERVQQNWILKTDMREKLLKGQL